MNRHVAWTARIICSACLLFGAVSHAVEPTEEEKREQAMREIAKDLADFYRELQRAFEEECRKRGGKLSLSGFCVEDDE